MKPEPDTGLQWPWCFHGFGMAEADGIASGHPSVLHVGNVRAWLIVCKGWQVKTMLTQCINLVVVRIRAYGQRCRMPHWNSHRRWLPHWIWHTEERWRPGTFLPMETVNAPLEDVERTTPIFSLRKYRFLCPYVVCLKHWMCFNQILWAGSGTAPQPVKSSL